MNPSTKDLLDAAGSVNADAVIILPNNSNIIMAANSAAELSETPCAVVPTKSVPQAFSALFAVDVDASLETNVEEMTEAAQAVKTGEVTWATRDSKDAEGNPIAEGDVIGIADGSIEAVDDSIDGAVLTLLGKMDAEDADTALLARATRRGSEALVAILAARRATPLPHCVLCRIAFASSASRACSVAQTVLCSAKQPIGLFRSLRNSL